MSDLTTQARGRAAFFRNTNNDLKSASLFDRLADEIERQRALLEIAEKDAAQYRLLMAKVAGLPATKKSCCRCGEIKPIEHFPRRAAGSADGRAGHCVLCDRQRRDKKWSATYRQKHPEKVREIQRRKFKTLVAGTVENKARVLLRTAVRKGLILKPEACEDCGQTVPANLIHGHHEDYSKPLDVRWLCVPCHNAHHAQVRTDLLTAKLEKELAP